MSNYADFEMESIIEFQNTSFKFEKKAGANECTFDFHGSKLMLGYILYDMLSKLCDVGNGKYEFEVQCAVNMLIKERLKKYEIYDKGDSENE